MKGLVSTVGALAALPLLLPMQAQAEHQHNGTRAHADTVAVNSTAYPNAPGNMPASGDKGKPVDPKTDPSAAPGAPAKAGTEAAPDKTATPTTAYPGAPGGTPASSDKGKPVEPKP